MRDTTRSARARQVAGQITPGGVHSNVRLSAPPISFSHGRGAWLYDVDGNDYVDYLLGQGPAFLGHAHPGVTEAVREAVGRGTVFGAQNDLENAAGELILRTVRWADRIRFGVTGTEVDQEALRIARAATGRTKFIRFEGHYHGWLDNVLSATVDGVAAPASKGQLASHLDDSIMLPFNDLATLARVLTERGDEVAAVIGEPIMCNCGVILPDDDFWPRVRQLTTVHGVVLILDEVISGFRLAPGGGAQYFGVVPDLATYGKALAGGWPVAALAGRADLMNLISAGVNHSGTFNAYLPGLAAVIAAQQALAEPGVYRRVADHGLALQRGLLDISARAGVPMQIQGLPMAFHLSFGDHGPARAFTDLAGLDAARYHAFSHVLAAHGVWVAGRGVWYVSTAHGERELDAVLERFAQALEVFASRPVGAECGVGMSAGH